MTVIEGPTELKKNRWPKLRWQERVSKNIGAAGIEAVSHYVLEICYEQGGEWLEVPVFDEFCRQKDFEVSVVKVKK